MKPQKYFWVFVAPALILFLSSCGPSFQKIEYQKAINHLDKKEYNEAINLFSKIIKRDPKTELAVNAARKAARTSLLETKDFSGAIGFYKELILYSQDQKERVEAQKTVANIYFEKLSNFELAILEFNKILSLPLSDEEKIQYRMSLARSYFQTNNFFQAGAEIEEILKQKISDEQKFETSLFKANLLITTKKTDDAISMLTELMTSFPEKAQTENIAMTLAVCYEEKNDFSKAIEVLNKNKENYPTPDFIELKIKRLKERQLNLPGAKGLRK